MSFGPEPPPVCAASDASHFLLTWRLPSCQEGRWPGPHRFTNRRKSVTRPVMAEAAAVSGDASSVRPPGPCRPSKLRLLVLTETCPGSNLSPFIAMHMLQPDSRQSAPASLKILSRPSSSASFLICWEPGTTTALPSAQPYGP